MNSGSYRPYKVCKFDSCNSLTRDEYCEQHVEIGQEQSRQKELDRYKDYTKYRRNKERDSFYQSSNWRKVRVYIIARDDGLCQHCLLDKKITKADVVHHIKYLETHQELALSPSNLISLCHRCHNNIHRND